MSACRAFAQALEPQGPTPRITLSRCLIQTAITLETSGEIAYRAAMFFFSLSSPYKRMHLILFEVQ